MNLLTRRINRRFAKNSKEWFLPRAYQRYRDEYGRENGYFRFGMTHSSSDDLSELISPIDYDHRLGYDFSHLNIRTKGVMPEHGFDQFISSVTLPSDKQQEENSIKAMDYLEGKSEGEVVVQSSESVSPKQFDSNISTLDWESSGALQRNSADDHSELSEVFEELGQVRTLADKKNFMRKMVMNEFYESEKLVNQPGEVYNQQYAYNPRPVHLGTESAASYDEQSLTIFAEARVQLEENIRISNIETKKYNVYRGDPDLWTSVAFNYDQSEKDKIAKSMKDYDEPQYYRDLFKESSQRIPKENKPPQEPFLRLPLKNHYEE
jgi:hypothetical protein